MANSVSATYDSSVLGATIYVRLRAAEAAVYTNGGANADFGLHAFNGNSRRRFGIHCRGVRLNRLSGAAPDQVVKSAFLPVGTEAALAAIALDSKVSIGGIEWTVKAKLPESSV